MEYNAAEIGTVDGFGNRPAEILRAEPRSLVFGNRRLCHLVEPNLLAVERWPRILHLLRRSRSQPVEIFAVKGVDQIDFTALETQHLHIAVGLNIKFDTIQIRQLPPL